MFRVSLCVALWLVVALPHEGGAQGAQYPKPGISSVAASIDLGAEIRVTTEDSMVVEGLFSGASDSFLSLHVRSDSVAHVQYSEVSRLLVLRSTHIRGAKVGAISGGLVGGLALGGLFGSAAELDNKSTAEAFAFGAVVGALGGMGLGALVGMVIVPAERAWVVRYPEDATPRPDRQWSLNWSPSSVSLSSRW